MNAAADRTPVILAARRTPVGRFMGALSRTPSPQLAAFAIEGLFAEHPSIKGHVDEAIFGCVLQAGVGQNPARQAGLKAGLPNTLSAQTINKVCGSGLQAVMLAAQSIKAGDNQLVIAGGMENMSLAPHFAPLRAGVKFGPATLEDHMQYDGLRCAFECWAMGDAADHTAKEHHISREDQDKFSLRSHQRAAEATKSGFFKPEIVPLTGAQLGNKKQPGPEGGLAHDEGFRADSSLESLARLPAVFAKGGTVTPGNASQISDGAAALCVASAAKAEELKIKPIARIVAYHTSGVAPKDIFTAPSFAVPALLKKAGLTVKDIDLFELNEAFAAQSLQNIRAAGIPEEKVNVCGGAIALGHPIGASGARVLTTLLHQMIRLNKKRGLAALCLGGGNAVAMLVER